QHYRLANTHLRICTSKRVVDHDSISILWDQLSSFDDVKVEKLCVRRQSNHTETLSTNRCFGCKPTFSTLNARCVAHRFLNLLKLVRSGERNCEIRFPRREHAVERVYHRSADVQCRQEEQSSCGECQ